MKKVLLLALLIIMGCSAETLKQLNELGDPDVYVKESLTDYAGVEYNERNTKYLIQQYNRDVLNPNIIYLTIFVNSRNKNVFDNRKTVEFRQAESRLLKNFMKDFDYKFYHIQDIEKVGGVMDNLFGSEQALLTVHFHKTEEEFDKWDRRYKD